MQSNNLIVDDKSVVDKFLELKDTF